MRNFSPAFGVILFCAAGCTTEVAPVTSAPVSVTPVSSSASKGVVGYDPIYVRTYIRPAGKSKTEVKNVSCEVKGGDYKAKVVTPGVINLPDKRDRSSPVNIICTKGDETRSAIVKPFNKTSADLLSSGAAGGLIGVVIMGGVDASRDKSGDEWTYPNAEIIFNQ